MLKKSMAAVVMVMVFALALAGCGGSDGVMSKGYGDLFRDKAAINKAVTEIKAKGGGTPLMIFQSMHFGPEFINFSRQDPKNKENVDNFVWTPNTGWQGPKIVKLSGGGKLEDNLFRRYRKGFTGQQHYDQFQCQEADSQFFGYGKR